MDHMVRAVSLFRMIRRCCQHEPYGSALDQGSLGVQLGSTATDFVLVVMHSKGP